MDGFFKKVAKKVNCSTYYVEVSTLEVGILDQCVERGVDVVFPAMDEDSGCIQWVKVGTVETVISGRQFFSHCAVLGGVQHERNVSGRVELVFD